MTTKAHIILVGFPPKETNYIPHTYMRKWWITMLDSIDLDRISIQETTPTYVLVHHRLASDFQEALEQHGNGLLDETGRPSFCALIMLDQMEALLSISEYARVFTGVIPWRAWTALKQVIEGPTSTTQKEGPGK